MPRRGEASIYWNTFVAVHGEPPWPCGYCGEPVLAVGGSKGGDVIHHINHDELDHRPENLVAMHRVCHTRHHHTGTKRAPEVGQKITAALAGRRMSDEQRAKLTGRKLSEEHKTNIGAAFRGRTLSEERKAKLRVPKKNKVPCPHCTFFASKGWVTRHITKEHPNG